MKFFEFNFLFLFIILFNVDLSLCRGRSEKSEREGKLFSLFNVVQFRNDACQTNEELSDNTYRVGTCYTSSECASKSGKAAGNCAAGFGVCCLLAKNSNETAVTSNVNNTYFQNPEFDSAYKGTSAITYTIEKEKSDICFIRLDFETFVLKGPLTGTSNGVCEEKFEITGGVTIPTICGTNTGQHLYIEFDDPDDKSVKLEFKDMVEDFESKWDIRASQIQCSASYKPPSGCLQYHTDLKGEITTFNYGTAQESYHLNPQSYSICIRRAEGHCCVEYSTCTPASPVASGETDPSFAFDYFTDTDKAKSGADCTEDYIEITGASQGCLSNNLKTKFCGARFNTFTDATENAAICDCMAPFTVGIHTVATTDPDFATSMGANGVCLNYSQRPC